MSYPDPRPVPQACRYLPMALGVITAAALFGTYPLLDAPARPVREPTLILFAPSQADRPLHLAGLEWPLRERQVGPLALRLGLLGSRAWGRIRQPGAEGEVWRDSPAWGLGPLAEASLTWRVPGGLRLGWTLSASVQWHDRDFPAGGQRHNGVFQTGPLLAWEGPDQVHCRIGGRWLHLSNGRGLGPDNPAYDGQGVALGCRWPL